MSRRALWFGVGLAGGLAAGLWWWRREQERHQRGLYSKRPLARLAALGWLRGRPGVETVVILREYVQWERHPVLQRRARRLLARFENALA
ncbi:MAG: hypothetical protein ACKVS7_13590 [Gemmatimonadaceae bacterium]